MDTDNYWKLYNRTRTGGQPRKFLYSTVVENQSSLWMSAVSPLENRNICIRHADMAQSYQLEAVWQGSQHPDDEIVLQSHDYFDMILVVQGELEIMIETGRFRFETGDAVLLNRNTRNYIFQGQDAAFMALCLSKEYLSEWPQGREMLVNKHRKTGVFFARNLQSDLDDNKDYMEYRLYHGAAGDEAIGMMNDIFSELHKRAPGYTHVLRGLVFRLFGILENGQAYQTLYVNLGCAASRDLVDEIKRYLSHVKRRVTRDELSNQFHYSRNYIAKVFAKYTGESLQDYNRRIYLNEAKRLLTESRRNISEIAEQVGFVNRTQFYTLFREYTGMSPQEYRTSVRSPGQDERKNADH